MEQQTPKAVAHLLRMATGGRTGIWVIFDAERTLYGHAGESRRALQIRWRRPGSPCPIVQRQSETFSQAEAEQFIAAMRQHLAAGVVHSVPAYFKACCWAVKHRTVSAGYERPGQELARRLATDRPSARGEDAWHAELQYLRRLIERADHAAALAWFDAHFPACMVLIPHRRRKAFLRGVCNVLQDSSPF
jgi:hypothetical protein